MHNWKHRHEIHWATFCWKRKSLFFSFKQKDDHTGHIIKYSVTVLMLFDNWKEVEASGTDEWEQKAEELYEYGWCTSQTFFILEDERMFMVFMYTRTGNVLEIIRRFHRHFPNQRTRCRQTNMDNYNKYVQYGLSLSRNIGNSGGSCSEAAFESFWLFPEHYQFLYTLKP